MAVVGYERVRQLLELAVFPVERPAVVRPVTRVEPRQDELAVPAHVAPQGDDPLGHLLFALNYEGTNLQLVAAASARIAI